MGDPMRAAARAAREKTSTAVAAVQLPPPPNPPDDAGEAGRRLWTGVVGQFDLAEHELAILREAVRTADLLEQLHTIVQRDGLMVAVLPAGSKVHPAAIEARQQRIALGRLLAAMQVPIGGDEDEDQDVRRNQRRSGVRGVYRLRGAS